MALSNALPSNATSATVAYVLGEYNASVSTSFLPISVSVFGEANDANQSGLDLNPYQVKSIADVITRYGGGSPIHATVRMLLDPNISPIGVPIWVYPQATVEGAQPKVIIITPSDTATGNGTVYVKVCGRRILDNKSYAVNINTGDTVTDISNKFRAVIANNISCPVYGDGTSQFVAISKWSGLTSDSIDVTIDTSEAPNIGVTFSYDVDNNGVGTPSVSASLAMIGNNWRPIIINCYGNVDGTLTEFETWNGIPALENSTGRYAGQIMRPAVVYTGTTADDITSSADARKTQLTIAYAPAPLNLCQPYEAAAAWAYRAAKQAQIDPTVDVVGLPLLGLPTLAAGQIPTMNDQTFREYCVQHGLATVEYVNGQYYIVDPITTYHPDTEPVPFYRFNRDLFVDFNYKYIYQLNQVSTCFGKTLVPDSSPATGSNVVKPKMWKARVAQMNLELEKQALLVNVATNNASIQVAIDGTNPNRLNTVQNTQISGVARVLATSVYNGFYTTPQN